MTHQIVTQPPAPGTPDWQRMITASKIPVILGLTPQWQTPSELWMVMSGLAEPEQLDGDHLDWGHIAEDSLVDWWKHKHPGWRTGRGEIAYTDTSLPFPNMATLDRRAVRGRAYRIIECKTSVDANTWDAEEALPGHVHTQVLSQQGMSGIHTADVVSQLGSTVPRIFPVDWDEELWTGIVDVVNDFYQTLGNTEPPMPPADLLEAVEKATTPIPTGEVDLPPEEVQDVLDLLAQRDQIEEQLEHAKQHLLEEYEANKIKVGGKSFFYPTPGKFSQKRIQEKNPDMFTESKHLFKDPEVQKTAFDAKKFADKYPAIAALGMGDPSWSLKNINKES